MLKENEVTAIRYTKKATSEVSERVIIPSFVPHSEANIKALDVTGLSATEIVDLNLALLEYRKYYEQALKNIFNFQDWVDHTQRTVSGEVKWRTFAVDSIEVIE